MAATYKITSDRVSACFVTAVVFLRSAYPVQFHFLLNSCVSAVSCVVRSHRLVLLIVFGQKTARTHLGQWFTKVCSMLIMLVAVLQVSQP